MADNLQTIEDLMKASEDSAGGEENAQTKFVAKNSEIKRKEVERLTKSKAASLGLPYINLTGFPISPEALSLIREDQAKTLEAVCFYYDGKKLHIGTTKPDQDAIDKVLEQLKEKYHCQASLYLFTDYSLEYAMNLYKALPKVRKIVRNIELTARDLDKFSEKFSSFRDLQAQINKAEITDIVTMIMAAAVKSESSDIHIEAEEEIIKTRFRIDGVLHDVAIMEKELWKKIISRLKGLSRVKINITDKPQDGRMSIVTKHERIDIRVSFLPTNFGESVVMRLLRSSAVGLKFEDLGIRGKAYSQLKKEIERPNGMIITTGPTGSGKTTTLYAILKSLNKQEAKIITIEDPIEYQLVGVNQSQTSDKYTFAKGLRSIVRQDPDVIMVGEIRDLETAEIAIQAALTGHLVLTTIHTNDAAGTVPRLLSMGTKPFLVSPALNAMIGQRLVRKICPDCKEEASLDKALEEKVVSLLENLGEEEKAKINFKKLKFYQGKGCEACQGIGYKGRVGIFEIMNMNSEIEKLILAGKVSEYDMREISAKYGMITMVQDGVLKALDGITTLAEVFRVSEEKL